MPFTPYWGPVTSSHDWCENNYEVTRFVAEFWNTLSSLPISALGIFGMWFTLSSSKTFRWSFLSAYFGLFVVGLGSALFHGTLLFEAQMADEFPMIVGSLIYAYIVLDVQFLTWQRQMTKSLHYGLVIGLTLFACAMAFVMLSDSSTHLPFILAYCGVVFYICAGSMDIVWQLNDPLAKKWFWISLIVYIVGGAIWLIERNFCGYANAFQYFHALWHLAAGYGTFSCLMCVFYVQVRRGSLTKKMLTANSLGIPFVDFQHV
jgi:dihydroceramidase